MALRRTPGCAPTACWLTSAGLTKHPSKERARRQAEMGRCEDADVSFTSGGSDSVDTAMKMIRRYWVAAGQPERRIVISREAAYHSMHTAGTGLAGIEAK